MDNDIAKLKHCHGLDIFKSIMVHELGIANFKHCHGQWQCQAQALSWTLQAL
jgi:hypothetical protein